MAGHKNKTAQGGERNRMKTEEMDIVHIDGNPHNNHIENLRPENDEPKRRGWVYEYENEIDFAVQEWGIKNELRLFGIEVNEYYDPQKKVCVPHAKGVFAGNSLKDLFLMHFDIKKTKEKITILRKDGFKYPIRILRSRRFITKNLAPVLPFYNVLIGRGIILPFRSQVKGKKRDALPFEDIGEIKAVKI
jgi:hypothetical protein